MTCAPADIGPASLVPQHGCLSGVGVDIEMVDRFVTPDARLFTAEELAYCEAQSEPAQSRAGRWCAKEAVVKACGKYLQLSPREIEIGVELSRRPVVVLPDRARELGLAAEVSIAHSGGFAIAVAMAGAQSGQSQPAGTDV